jgi:3-oxoacyl-(acyl-carrier-protein) synthase
MPYKLHISSIKGSTGHSLGAAGGLEAIACVKVLEKGIIPPTINYVTPDPDCDLNYTPNKVKHLKNFIVEKLFLLHYIMLHSIILYVHHLID